MYYNTRMQILIFILLVLAILVEIILCTLCVIQLINLQKKVLAYNDKLILLNSNILEANNKIKELLKKINKVVSFFDNEKFTVIKKTIRIAVVSIQVMMLLRSLDFSKGWKSVNYKNIKKVLYAEVFKKIFNKTIDFLKDFEDFCKNEGK